MSRPAPYDDAGNRERVARLIERDVDVWGPERVYVAADVPLENIEPGAVLRNAALSGSQLRIGRGSRIGVSGHARVADCQIGRDVALGAGSYENATLLDGARVRGFAELREGTLLEEQTEAAHSVAFKNTILTATVVTGSLINYCDIFMSGGTSRDDHSEVGSGVIHFNFDPRGDKWSTLIGDVRGVLLRSAPVFVGGHCGLVGPLHVDFGAVVAAGSIVRRDVGPDCVQFESADTRRTDGFDREIYTGLKRKFLATAKLVGNLHALDAWYEHVRMPFAEDHHRALYGAAREQIRRHIAERAKQLDKIIGKLERSIEKSSAPGGEGSARFHGEHRLLLKSREQIADIVASRPDVPPPPEVFLQAYAQSRQAASHIEAIQQVSHEAASMAAGWLGELADMPTARMRAALEL